MYTADPAAGAALSFSHFVETYFDAFSAGFGQLAACYPADPLVTRQWRNILPQAQCPCIAGNGSCKIIG
jgi:hypothetical protein